MSKRYGFYAAFYPGEFSPRMGMQADSKRHYRQMVGRLPKGTRVERLGD